MTDFMSALKDSAEAALPNVSVTENGAVGYKTTGNKLLDLNFMLSSMRNMDEEEIWIRFMQAYNENPTLTMLWLFFARDCRDGCGERRTFRVIFKRFCRENPRIAGLLMHLLPVYGRWDDVIDVYASDVPCEVRESAFRVIMKQLMADLDNERARKPISLLAKWLPSPATSSKETRRRAEMLRNALGYTPRQYRKMLSKLRGYLGVTERFMSANEWDQINYEAVPSRAAMNYREAFGRHDGDRYTEYLSNVKEGKAKINASTLYPYDIVHAYMTGDAWDERVKDTDDTLEAQWKALPSTVPDNQSTLVIVDGSGSMSTRIGSTTVTCHDVARSLGIYFSEKLKGPFKDRFITFSANPKYVDLSNIRTLRNKLALMVEYDDCSNTDLAKTFDLILGTAVTNHLSQDELPVNILIVSDGEFDGMTYHYERNGHSGSADAALFDTIRHRWEANGYKLPRLVFWNVCSRTGTIPVKENDFGVALVSGFSPSIADMVMSAELDPYKCLVNKITSDRYYPVLEALKE